jgi:predicted nucleotidyltransferase
MDSQAEVWLVGSRVQDDLRGGDIDLLVKSTQLSFSKKVDLLVALKLALGDQKIDLRVVDPFSQDRDPWVEQVLQTAIRLG